MTEETSALLLFFTINYFTIKVGIQIVPNGFNFLGSQLLFKLYLTVDTQHRIVL